MVERAVRAVLLVLLVMVVTVLLVIWRRVMVVRAALGVIRVQLVVAELVVLD